MSGARFTAEELQAATGGRWIHAVPCPAAGVSTDSRAVAEGSAFVALRGERFDAHEFLAQAAAAGAAGAVVSEAWAARSSGTAPPGLPLLAVPDTLAALGAIARFHRSRFHVPLVAVTGSNGKTTTREMLGAILRTRGPALKTEGNLNNEIGLPLTLLGLEAGHWAGVVEMGMNHAGEIARLAAIALPQLAVVTNAGPAHLGHFASVEAVADAKAELYQALPPGGIAIANADDPRMLRRAQATGRRLLTFAVGRDRDADVVATEVLAHGPEGLTFLLGVGNRELTVKLSLVGLHNQANAAAAAAAAVALGCSDQEIVRGLAEVRPVGRRLRMERLPSGALLLDDCYNANPASMSAALLTLAELAGRSGGRALAVLGDMLELGPAEAEAHRALGAEAAPLLKGLAAFGPRSRHTADGAREAGLPAADLLHAEEIAPLAAWVRERLAPGDVLLVKGSRGMKLERLVEAIS
ncbi:MAG: UDP-N-acetylmuramoyl-tripeptide--D-alanyl-D-alanine ligase [Deltaproteobacteria bacterium]|nr:UDP-N-acetylmuramoyl-tripeptide--D-alanyl-D-alanine ligase [Deltaproteobacteria bacterium]